MRWLLLFVFVGVALPRNVAPFQVHQYPSNLAWLFGLNDKEKEKENKEETRTVCRTEECEKIAKVMLQNMDKSVDPCDDFYEYACGKWPEHNPLPEGSSSWSLWEMLEENVNQQIEDILKEGPKDTDLLAVKLAKKWYSACMDTDAMDKRGLDPLVSTLSRVGGWPMIMDPDEWDEREYSWQKVDNHYARLTGRNSLHNVRVYRGFNKSGVVYVDTPYLPPGSYKIWSGDSDDSDEVDDSDEDLSDEEKHSGENSEEPGSENDNDENDDDGDNNDVTSERDDDKKGKSPDRLGHKKSKKPMNSGRKKNNNRSIKKLEDSEESGSENDNDENDDDDDNSDVTSEQDNDKKGKSPDRLGHKKSKKPMNSGRKKNNNRSIKKLEDSEESRSENDDDDDDSDVTSEQDNDKKGKSPDKLGHKKSKKYSGRKKNNNRIIKKPKESRTDNKHRIKRAVTREVDGKRPQRLTHRHKLNRRKSANAKKAFETSTSTTPRFTTERTNDDDEMLVTRQLYADYISNVAHAIAEERGMTVPKQHIDKDIEDMIEFQLKLTEIAMESGEDLELTLDDFQEWYDEKKPQTKNSKIDWVHKFTDFFDEAGVTVDGYLDIEVSSPDYFKALVSLLDETSSRTIVNYIHWNFLSRIIRTTTSEMRKLYDAWVEADDEEIKTRSAHCIREVEMSDILAYEYVRNHFSDDITKTAMDMIDDIQKEVEYLIKGSDWMDDDTKDFVLAKLVNMDKLVGYPDWYRNNTIVRRYFQGLIIGKSYYENTLSYRRYFKWNQLRRLMPEDEDFETWWISPVTLNAFFDPEENAIGITAADFQSPLFAYNRPQTINFGIIGFIMAHEVNHGFDDTGHLYDKNGEFMKWLSTMADAYGERAECFVEQFNNYPIDKALNKKIKNYGNQTAGENIADTMGLQAVFRAYRRRERECGKPDASLPGLEELNNDQLFFLSFGNLWCEVTDLETLMQDAKMDSHSIGRLRVIGSVSNSEDFAKAYNCPVGSPMNPEKKCNIWK